MGNASSSNKTAPAPSASKKEERHDAPVVIESTPKPAIQEPVVVESLPVIAPKDESPVVVDATVQVVTQNVAVDGVGVASVTEAFERIKITEEDVPTEFSMAGNAWKLDTAEDVADLVRQITSLKNLQKVSFAGNTLGVDASKALARALDVHENLRDVDLSDCFTGRMKEEVPVSVAAFAAVLVKKMCLARVNLSDNAFGPVGAKALVELLSGSSCLQDLILNNNGLGPEGGRIVAEALIASAKNRAESEHGRPLRTVHIGRNRLENGSCAAFAKMLEAHSSIEEFSLPQCGIRSEGIVILSEALCKCHLLKTVDLQDNTFTASGAKAFAAAIPSWTSLCSLNIGDCMCEAEGSALVIGAMASSGLVQTLESFNFQYNEMREDGAQILADAVGKFGALKRLMLNGNAFNPDGDAAVAIRAKLDVGLLDEWSDMDYGNDEDSALDDDDNAGFITEKERQELVVQSEGEAEAEEEVVEAEVEIAELEMELAEPDDQIEKMKEAFEQMIEPTNADSAQ